MFNYQQVQQPMQIQNGGFVSIRSEMEARSYPVAYGTSVTFKDETGPYIYVKTMGFSQLESPRFEKYRLTKEEPTNGPVNSYDELRSQIEELKTELRELRGKYEQSIFDVSAANVEPDADVIKKV